MIQIELIIFTLWRFIQIIKSEMLMVTKEPREWSSIDLRAENFAELCDHEN